LRSSFLPNEPEPVTCSIPGSPSFDHPLYWPEWTSNERIVFFILFTLFWLIAYPFYYQWAVKRNERKTYSESASKGLLGEHPMVIDAKGVSERSAIGRIENRVERDRKNQRRPQRRYLYIGPL